MPIDRDIMLIADKIRKEEISTILTKMVLWGELPMPIPMTAEKKEKILQASSFLHDVLVRYSIACVVEDIIERSEHEPSVK